MPMPCGEMARGPTSMREMISHASGSIPNLKASARITDACCAPRCDGSRGSDLLVLGHPRAVLDLEVAEQQRRLLEHDPPDLVEDETDLLLGPRVGAHL